MSLKKIAFLFVFIAFINCSGDDLPENCIRPLNISISRSFDNPDFNKILTIGSVEINGGRKGILLINKGLDRFLAFSRSTTAPLKSPVSFFRNFLVESDGAHKDGFDIKNRAMAPLIGAARVLSLYHGLKNVNRTSTRYEQLSMLEPENRELYESCAYAFKALLKFRVQQGLKNGDSGRFIQLESLSKSDRLKLKRCFKPLRDVQEVLRVRFQTQNLS